MAKRNLTLEHQPETEFLLAGIVSAENDYKVCWALNQILTVSLGQVEPLLINSRGKETEFPLFYYQDSLKVDYYLIPNKSGAVYLLDELKNIDYLLKISDVTAIEVIEKLKNARLFTAVSQIKYQQLKMKAKLFF